MASLFKLSDAVRDLVNYRRETGLPYRNDRILHGNPEGYAAEAVENSLQTGNTGLITPRVAELAEGSSELEGVFKSNPVPGTEKTGGILTSLLGPRPDTAPHLNERAYHWTRRGDPFSVFGTRAFDKHDRHWWDSTGVHSGTERAATDRKKSYNAGRTMPMAGQMLKLDTDQSVPFDVNALDDYITQELGKPQIMSSVRHQMSPEDHADWSRHGEYPFQTFLEEAWRMTNGQKDPYTMGQDLAKAGYTHVPYRNDIEDLGSISQLHLTRRDGAPAVLRTHDARKDPRFMHLPNIRWGVAGAVPAGGLAFGADQYRDDQHQLGF